MDDDDDHTLRALIRQAVLALEAADRGPTADMLAEAPSLENWQVIRMRGSIVLAGKSAGTRGSRMDGSRPLTCSLSAQPPMGAHLVAFLSPWILVGVLLNEIDAFKGSRLELLDMYGWPPIPVDVCPRGTGTICRSPAGRGCHVIRCIGGDGN